MVDAANKAPSNGHSNQPVPDDVKAFLDFDGIKNAFTTQNISSAIDKLVERGDKIEDLIMRGKFWNIDHMNSWVKLLRKASHFKDPELEQLLMNHLAGCTSINGERIDILLRAVIGRNETQIKQSFGSKMRNWVGLDKENGDK